MRGAQTRGVGDTPAPPMPEALVPVLQRLAELPGLDNLDQATVNEYPPGVGLSPHIDTHSAFTGGFLPTVPASLQNCGLWLPHTL